MAFLLGDHDETTRLPDGNGWAADKQMSWRGPLSVAVKTVLLSALRLAFLYVGQLRPYQFDLILFP